MCANTSTYRREWVFLLDQIERINKSSGCNQRHIAWNIDICRAGILTRGYKQSGAYSCTTVFVFNMFFILITEITNGAQYRIWSSLPKSTHCSFLYGLSLIHI